jgi:hypothetical protein
VTQSKVVHCPEQFHVGLLGCGSGIGFHGGQKEAAITGETLQRGKLFFSAYP